MGAQWYPPRTQIPYFSFKMSAISLEWILCILKAITPFEFSVVLKFILLTVIEASLPTTPLTLNVSATNYYESILSVSTNKLTDKDFEIPQLENYTTLNTEYNMTDDYLKFYNSNF